MNYLSDDIRDLVRMAINDGRKPRLHWWQFSRQVWDGEFVEEYHRQMEKAK